MTTKAKKENYSRKTDTGCAIRGRLAFTLNHASRISYPEISSLLALTNQMPEAPRAAGKTCFVARPSEDGACEDADAKSPEATPEGSSRTFRVEDETGAIYSRPQQKEVLPAALNKAMFLEHA